MELKSVRALVTGGARGMGACFVQELREAGAQAFAVDVSTDFVGPGGVADVSKEEDVDRIFAEAEAAMGGPVNLLVNNAGILRDGLLIKVDKESGAVSTLEKSKWDAVLAVNLTGPFLCAREFAARAVKANSGGVIVNMSSISRSGNAGQSNYSAAKAGLVADTALWAKELARYGIRVGAVAPGFINTPMVAGMKPEALAKVTAPVPLKRLGEPREIWMAIRFIVECDYFTGRVVEVDGGLVL